MKKFLNDGMQAPNVMRVPIDPVILRDLAPLATSRFARMKLYSQSPPWRSDIRWFSARFRSDFSRFRTVFDRLGVASHVEPYVDLSRGVRLYNSFLVIRSSCKAPDFHVDWTEANNEGFTLMTPLTENCGGFGMLYKRVDGTIAEYDYKIGEALIFGDDFVHSTKPGSSPAPVVLLCFNFGTDKIQHWDKLERTASRQSILYCRPDGRFERRPFVKRVRNIAGRTLRSVGLGGASARSSY